jgi:hypothetical protein
VKTEVTMKFKSAKPSATQFAVHHTYITHVDTGQELPLIRIIAKIVSRTSLAVVVQFYDASSRLRQEEMLWIEYRSWSKFYTKMLGFGYCCDDSNLLKLLHR